MRNLMILPLISLFLVGCQTPPPVYSTTYHVYVPSDCRTSDPDCRPAGTTKTKPRPPRAVEQPDEVSGGGRALKPSEW